LVSGFVIFYFQGIRQGFGLAGLKVQVIDSVSVIFRFRVKQLRGQSTRAVVETKK